MRVMSIPLEMMPQLLQHRPTVGLWVSTCYFFWSMTLFLITRVSIPITFNHFKRLLATVTEKRDETHLLRSVEVCIALVRLIDTARQKTPKQLRRYPLPVRWSIDYLLQCEADAVMYTEQLHYALGGALTPEDDSQITKIEHLLTQARDGHQPITRF